MAIPLDADLVFSKAKQLRHSSDKFVREHVYINRDLTKAEIAAQATLNDKKGEQEIATKGGVAIKAARQNDTDNTITPNELSSGNNPDNVPRDSVANEF